MYCRVLIFISTLIILVTVNVSAQSLNNSVSLKEKNLGGPRMGLTIIHGRGEIVNRLEANNMDRLVSQFGWHFEYQVSPESTIGPAFVVQFINCLGE